MSISATEHASKPARHGTTTASRGASQFEAPCIHGPGSFAADATHVAKPRTRTRTRTRSSRSRWATVLGISVWVWGLGACASSADSRDPLQEELERIKREEEQQGGQTQCRPGKEAQCYSGDADLAGRGACTYGIQTCGDNNRWGPCKGEGRPLPRELCNAIDDDCNGVVDDGFPRTGHKCTTGVGECLSDGKWACRANGADAICNAPTIAPSGEVCDGKDNDCDGEIDEEDTQGNGDYCTTGRKGPCRRGHKVCVAGGFQCISDHEAGQEICNQKDDDCDGEIDDDCITYTEYMELQRDAKAKKNSSNPR